MVYRDTSSFLKWAALVIVLALGGAAILFYKPTLLSRLKGTAINTAPLSLCQNGKLDVGEPCDGTLGINVPHTVCSNDCNVISQTYCGDGKKQKPNDEKKGGPNNDGMEACDNDAGIDAKYAYTYKFDEKCSDQCTVVNVPPTSGLEIKGFPIAGELSGSYVATLKAVNSDRTKKLIVMLKGYNALVQHVTFTRPEENCQIHSTSAPENYTVLSSDTGACYAKIELSFNQPGTALLKVLQFYADQLQATEAKNLFIEVQPPPPLVVMESQYASMNQNELLQRVSCYTPVGLNFTTNYLKTELELDGAHPTLTNVENLGSLLRFTIPNPSVGAPSSTNLNFKCTLKVDQEYQIIGPHERDPDLVIFDLNTFPFVESDPSPPLPQANIRDMELEVEAHDDTYAVTTTKQYGTGSVKPIHYEAFATFSDPNLENLTYNFTVPQRATDYFQIEPCTVITGNLYDPTSEGLRPWQLRNDVEAQYAMDGRTCQVHLNLKLIVQNKGLQPGDQFDLPQEFKMALKHETTPGERRDFTFKISAKYEELKNPALESAVQPPPPVCGDEKIEGEEQCEDGNTISGDGCSSECQNENTVVFVTESVYPGNLSTLLLPGISGADEKCQAAAFHGDLPKRTGIMEWKAVISDDTQNIADAFMPNTIMRLDGKVIAQDKKALFSGNLKNPPNVTEALRVITDVQPTAAGAVWTGSMFDGHAAVNFCKKPAAPGTTSKGTAGLASATNGKWLSANPELSCSFNASLYCYGIGVFTGLTPPDNPIPPTQVECPKPSNVICKAGEVPKALPVAKGCPTIFSCQPAVCPATVSRECKTGEEPQPVSVPAGCPDQYSCTSVCPVEPAVLTYCEPDEIPEYIEDPCGDHYSCTLPPMDYGELPVKDLTAAPGDTIALKTAVDFDQFTKAELNAKEMISLTFTDLQKAWKYEQSLVAETLEMPAMTGMEMGVKGKEVRPFDNIEGFKPEKSGIYEFQAHATFKDAKGYIKERFGIFKVTVLANFDLKLTCGSVKSDTKQSHCEFSMPSSVLGGKMTLEIPMAKLTKVDNLKKADQSGQVSTFIKFAVAGRQEKENFVIRLEFEDVSRKPFTVVSHFPLFQFDVEFKELPKTTELPITIPVKIRKDAELDAAP